MAIWEEYSDYLVTAIHNIHMVMDCNIVLGGSLTPYFHGQLSYLRKKLRERSFFSEEEDFLFLGRCEGKANCIGVALHFIAGFLESI